MKYCQRCVIPDSRPNIQLNAAGICNACAAPQIKEKVDWSAREQRFRQVVEQAQSRSHGYDCVIPVSGGKDSTWQVVTCLKYGLKPLAVTWRPPLRTAIGQKNLDNLVSLGVDHIDYQINPEVEKKFLREAVIRTGTPAVPMHMAIFHIPITIAFRFQIPLVVWGENSALEYGGTEAEQAGDRMDAVWLKKYGVTQGTSAADWISEALTKEELTPYFGPTEKELEEANLSALFLGFYFPWDPEHTARVAQDHGFEVRAEGPRTGYYNHTDIDDDLISVHHYLKWHKFGFTRLFDNLSLEIRNGRMTRPEAIEIIRQSGTQTPIDDIRRFCNFVRWTEEEFFQIIEKFRNPEVWAQSDGVWTIPDFLIPDWDWNEEAD